MKTITKLLQLLTLTVAGLTTAQAVDSNLNLWWSIEAGNAEAAAYWIREGNADVNASCDNPINPDWEGITPLQYAVQQRSSEIAQLLIIQGARVRTQEGERSQNLLHMAAFNGDIDMVWLLIQSGANIHESAIVRRSDGEFARLSPLLIAAEAGHETVTDLLLIQGAYRYSSRTPITPLQHAVHNRLYNAVETLLERGINPDQAPGNGRTRPPLIMAAIRGDLEMTQILLEYGANINIPVAEGSGITALTFATREGHEAIVRELLDLGANPNTQDMTGRTPFLIAARQSHTEMVRLFVENPTTNIDLTDNQGMTALHLTAEANSVESVRLILSREPSHINAAEHTHGWTALHYAVSNRNTTMAALLLEAGADPNMEDHNGQTPWDLAVGFDNRVLSNLLELYGAIEAIGSSSDSESDEASTSSDNDDEEIELYIIIGTPSAHALTLREVRSAEF